MTAEENRHVVVCQNLRDFFTDLRVDGSALVRAACQHQVWISPEAQKFIQSVSGVAICGDCWMKNPGDPENMRELPGEREAMERIGVDSEHYERMLNAFRDQVEKKRKRG